MVVGRATFLLGPGLFSGANLLLVFRGVSLIEHLQVSWMDIRKDVTSAYQVKSSAYRKVWLEGENHTKKQSQTRHAKHVLGEPDVAISFQPDMIYP